MKLKETLQDINAVKIRGEGEPKFTLKSGKESRLFIDVKGASLEPVILKMIAHELRAKINTIGYDKLAGVALGGVPIVVALSLSTEIPYLMIRAEKHDRGLEQKVIGFCKDDVVLLVEDVATTGGSIVEAVKAIRAAGGLCTEALVVVDREEGAEELCNKNNIELISLLRKRDFGITGEL